MQVDWILVILTMSAKLSTGLAGLVSVGVIVVCTVAFALLINDINVLYDEIVSDLDSVRGINRDAWDGMMEIQRKKSANDVSNLFNSRRTKKDVSSNCSKFFLVLFGKMKIYRLRPTQKSKLSQRTTRTSR